MKGLMAVSVVLTVAGAAILARGVPVGDGDAVVTGRPMPPAELERVAGARTTGPCMTIGDCSRLPCTGPVGTACSYCSGTGMDEFCACYDDSPCAVTRMNCGFWMYGICGGNGRCGAGMRSPLPCARTSCSGPGSSPGGGA